MKTLVVSLLIATAHCFVNQAQAQQLREMFAKTNPSVVVQSAGLLVMRAAENSPASDLRLIAGTIPTNIGGAELVNGDGVAVDS